MTFQIAHILVSHKEADEPIDARDKSAALNTISDALDRIKDGAKFQAVAAEISDCPSGATGGLLGPVQKGEMVKPFEDISFALNVNQVSDVFETEYGYHLAWRYEDSLLA